ncbi:MAG: hypothetical protein RL208_560 [Pseudomonadota bacterium]|jgi:geranylgeranyl pyrophosphate synthase
MKEVSKNSNKKDLNLSNSSQEVNIVNQIQEKINKHIPRVNKEIDLILSFNKEDDDFNQHLIEVMRYAVLSGGRRYRSFFLLLLGELYNINKKDLFTLGAVIEMIHAHLIMQDDLPSMDNDDYRNEKLTCHKKYGENETLLATNALLTTSFEVLSDEKYLTSIPSNIRSKIIKIISKYSGKNGIIGGQYMSIAFKKQEPSEHEITRFRKLKSSSLFIACAEIAAGIQSLDAVSKRNLVNIANLIGILTTLYHDITKWQTNITTQQCSQIQDRILEAKLLTEQNIQLLNTQHKKTNLESFIKFCLYKIEEISNKAKINTEQKDQKPLKKLSQIIIN